MSKITLEPNSSGAGTFSIVSPSSNSNRSLVLPDADGDLLTLQAGIPTSSLTGTIERLSLPSGSVVKQTFDEDNTREVLSSTPSYLLWSIPFTKLLSSNESDILVYALMPGYGSRSFSMGLYAHVNGSTSQATDGSAYRGIDHTSGAGNRSVSMFITVNGKRLTGLGTGSHNLEFGWNVRNNNDARPFTTWNPNSTDDGRDHQTGSTCTIMEVRK